VIKFILIYNRAQMYKYYYYILLYYIFAKNKVCISFINLNPT